jgi:hypothetical protein
VTLAGTRYLRDRARLHEDVRAELSKNAEAWESGTMTKADKRDALVSLVVLAWKLDEEAMAEARADLRAHGFDPER